MFLRFGVQIHRWTCVSSSQGGGELMVIILMLSYQLSPIRLTFGEERLTKSSVVPEVGEYIYC